MAARIALLVLFVAGALFLYGKVRAVARVETPDAAKTILLFFVVIAFGAVAIVLLETWLLPIIGERVGNFFYGSNARVTRHRHARAQAKVDVG